MIRSLILLLMLSITTCALGEQWQWQWPTRQGDTVPQAEICPFKYGKHWGYTVIIDDGPAFTSTVSQPVLAQYTFTDAPPGLAGGRDMPFVGGAAVIVMRVGTSNRDYIHWADLHKLKSLGWDVVNHSYTHSGRTYSQWPEILTAEQLRREMFWSQTVCAAEMGSGRAPSHFVYPNGYTPYRDFLTGAGIWSASRSSGKDAGDAYSDTADVLDLHRVYLDEANWTGKGEGRVLFGFPPDDKPAPGQVILDFTHKMEADPQSANRKRWDQRLQTIANRFGKAGRDNLWSAPPGDIYDYVAARKQAKVQIQPGKLTVTLPDSIPGSPLTLKLTGIDPAIALSAPTGGSIYRKGDQVWLTTPCLGQPGVLPPSPQLKRIYSGPPQDFTWDKPISLAAVRLLQNAPAAEGYEIHLEVQTAQGPVKKLASEELAKKDTAGGRWLLFDLVPNQPAVQINAVKVTPDKTLGKMEVWVLDQAKTQLR